MSRLPLLGAVLGGLLALGGCSDAVDPTLGTDQAVSLYGHLDPTAARQAIRVVAITRTIEADTNAVLGATVTSVEPATGRTAAWRDSVVTYADGTTGHVFVADYTPTPGVRVDVTVVADDGREAVVSVEVPPLATAEVGPVLAGAGPAAYPVTVRGVPRVIGGALRLHVQGVPNTEGVTTLAIPLEAPRIEASGGDWTVVVPFLAAVREALQAAGLFDAGLTLVEAEYIAVVTNDEWAVPPGGFDLDAIVEPGAFTNVAGGFGFVGAAYRTSVRWVPDANVLRLAGFDVIDDPAAQMAINEIGSGYVELFNPTTLPIRIGEYVVSMGAFGSGTVIPAGTEVAGRAFYRVDGAFEARAEAAAVLYDPNALVLSRAFVEADADAWGAYPDGYSYPLGRTGQDLFYGPVWPSPGEPNELVVVEAVINEISSGYRRFVEAHKTAAYTVGTLRTETTIEGVAHAGALFQGSGPQVYANETLTFSVNPLGGTVYLRLDDRVVDVRRYETQDPARSSGYLPDGPNGDWTLGLRPSPGGPNLLPPRSAAP